MQADFKDVFTVQFPNVIGDMSEVGRGLERGMGTFGMWVGIGLACSGIAFGLGTLIAAIINRTLARRSHLQ